MWWKWCFLMNIYLHSHSVLLLLLLFRVISLCIVRGLRFSLQDGHYVRRARGGHGARYAREGGRRVSRSTSPSCSPWSAKSSGFSASYQHGYSILGSAALAISSVISKWFTDWLVRIYLSCDLLSIAFITSPVILCCYRIPDFPFIVHASHLYECL